MGYPVGQLPGCLSGRQFRPYASNCSTCNGAKSVTSPFQASQSDPNSSCAITGLTGTSLVSTVGACTNQGPFHKARLTDIAPSASCIAASNAGPGRRFGAGLARGESPHLLRRRKVWRRAENRTVAGTIKVRAILMVPSSRSCAGRLTIEVDRTLTQMRPGHSMLSFTSPH